jgi:glycosyltransferase involved in cell wall biosynthesis
LELRIGTSEKYSVIYPGVERLRIFSKQKYKGKFGLQENQITIGWMGRITSIKNPLEILEIAQKLPECKFIVAGDGEKDLLDHLKNKAGKNISFTGWSKPQDFWSACDIALLTSKNEAQPIVIVEANYAALPVVARDVGAVSEVIISGRNGFLFDTIEKAVECIRILVANEKMRKTMGDEGMQMAISRYGISRFIDEHLKAYSSIKN